MWRGKGWGVGVVNKGVNKFLYYIKGRKSDFGMVLEGWVVG